MAPHCSQPAARHWLPAVAVVGISVLAAPVHGEVVESFDGGEPTWRLDARDRAVRLLTQERTTQGARHGPACEHFALVVGPGGTLDLTHAIPPAQVIDDLEIALQVLPRATGAQLRARVVFPHCRRDGDGGPYTATLVGTRHDQVGSWRRLELKRVGDQFAAAVRALRLELGDRADPRGAYVDQIGVRLEGDPGLIHCWIDQLEMSGAIPPGAVHVAGRHWAARDFRPDIPLSAAAGANAEPDASSQSRPRLQAGALWVEGRPFLPRVIEHHGEAPELLAELGLNAIAVDYPPSPELAEACRRAGLWIVGPPGSDGPRLLAWNCEQPTPPAAPGRPVAVGQAAGDLLAASRRFEVLRIDRPLSDPWIPPGRIPDVLSGVRQEVRPGSLLWATLPTEPTPDWIAQVRRLARGAMHPAGLNSDALRQRALLALAAGARGIWYRSDHSLADSTPEAQHRRDLLASVNDPLVRAEPFLAAAEPAPGVATAPRGITVAALRSSHSVIVVAARAPTAEATVWRPQPPRELPLTVSGPLSGAGAWRLDTHGLTPLAATRVAGGLRIVAPDFRESALLLISQDPHVAARLMRDNLAGQDARNQRLERSISRRIEWASAVDRELRQLRPESRRGGGDLLARSKAQLAYGQQQASLGDGRSARRFLEAAEDLAAAYEYEIWKAAAADFPPAADTPLLRSFATIPAHWSLAADLAADPTQAPVESPNLLPAGDFESLSHLQRTGWRNHRRPDPRTTPRIELSPERPHSGRYALRMTVDGPKDPLATAGFPDRAAATVVSAPVTVEAGDFLRIDAVFRGLRSIPPDQPAPVLVVADSLAGDPDALRVEVRSDQWRPLVLYRAAPRRGPLQIRLSLLSPGGVCLDDLQVRKLPLPQ